MGSKAARRTEPPFLERFSIAATEKAGSSAAFAIALGVVLVWALTGPLFAYSDTWQLVINTGTTVVTFLMVFLIQRAQNKEARALHLKLNEIVAALEGASNRLVGVEDLTEEELEVLRGHYAALAEMNRRRGRIHDTHSLEEAARRHDTKTKTGRKSVSR
jgi:low affinity Fe/Cu permease